MSFDYSPPRWWVPAAIVVALVALAVLATVMALLGYGLWQLLQALPDGLLAARIAGALGPLRLT